MLLVIDVVRCKWSGRRRVVGVEVSDTSCQGKDRAEVRIFGSSEPNYHALSTILLGGELESGEGGGR